MSILATFGRRLFGNRLYVGLAIAVVGLDLLAPTPFMQAPYIASQLFAMACIGAGLALRAWGSGCAGAHTRSAQIESRDLVTGGPFAFVRNPIYLGTILLGMGMSALIGDKLAYGLSALAFSVLYFGIIPAEEEHLQRTFGERYTLYRAEVPRLIPRVSPWAGRTEVLFRWKAARGELFIGLLVVLIYVALQFGGSLDSKFSWP